MGAERFNYITDALGSVVALTNESGSVAARYDYAPYGELIDSSGTVDNPWRFASGYFDEETDLYKFGTRYYDPSLGRWTQQDPVKGNLPSPMSLNLYLYVQCDPINSVDPTGRSCSGEEALALALALGLTGEVATAAAEAIIGGYVALGLAASLLAAGIAVAIIYILADRCG